MKFNNVFKKKVVLFVALMMLISVLATGCAAKTDTTKSVADTYPTQNINGIIPWGAGGGTDTTSRTIAPYAEKALGKTIIMTNKTGGGGAVGTQYVFDQKSDGYTMLFAAENPSTYQVLGLSTLSYADFTPIIISVKGNTAIIVPKDSKYNSFADLIADAKANPSKINMGISGVGTQPFVANAVMAKNDKVKFNTVAFDGDGPLVTALLGKQVDVTGVSSSVAMQYILNGDVKCLGLMSNTKLDVLPNVPAIGELRPEYKADIDASGFFFGCWVKKDVDAAIVKKLQDAFQTAFKTPEFQAFCKKNGYVPLGYTGDEAAKYTENWRSRLSWLLQDSGAAKDSPEKFNIPKPQ